jgi:hypothetical protein
LVVILNCCDEYGNCRQGRDCPVRIARPLQPSTFKRLLRRFSYWLFIAVFSLLWMAFVAIMVANYA